MASFTKTAFAVAVAGGAVLGAVEAASAMEVSAACRTADEINTGMANEGYVPVVVANDAKSNSGRFYYMNPADKTAYLVFSDKPLGTRPGCARVQSRWPQSELIDARRSNELSPVKWAGDADFSNKACNLLGKSQCGFYDNQIKEYSKGNLTPYFRGVTPQQALDGKPSGDVMLTVLGISSSEPTASSDQTGKTIGTYSSGMTVELFDYSYVGYTKAGIQILDDRAKLTSNISSGPNVTP